MKTLYPPRGLGIPPRCDLYPAFTAAGDNCFFSNFRVGVTVLGFRDALGADVSRIDGSFFALVGFLVLAGNVIIFGY